MCTMYTLAYSYTEAVKYGLFSHIQFMHAGILNYTDQLINTSTDAYITQSRNSQSSIQNT